MLLTMGGIPESYAFLSQLQQHRNTCFVVLGQETIWNSTTM